MNIKQIDLRLLRSFLTVARTGNFVRASEALNITQTALSQQKKELAVVSWVLMLFFDGFIKFKPNTENFFFLAANSDKGGLGRGLNADFRA